MLLDPIEIEIISKARQKNVRNPDRSREHFKRIFSDFIKTNNMEKQVLLDLGPGQYDFGVVAQKYGAEVECIDNDAAVLELGEYKGFNVFNGNIQDITSFFPENRFDGVFCKFAINAFWFHDEPEKIVKIVDDISSLMKPDAWAWIAPWNGVSKKSNLNDVEVQRILDIQRDAFVQHGFRSYNLPVVLAKRYGVHGATANRALFTKNLKAPLKLWPCKY